MKKSVINIAPLLLLIATNLLGLILFFQIGESTLETTVLFMGISLLSVLVYVIINKCDMGDPYLFLIATMLATIGIIVVTSINPLLIAQGILSESINELGIDNMKMYLIGVALFFLTILIYRLFYKNLAKLAPVYFIVLVALYLLTLILGKEIRGVRNWIMIGGFSVQTSEFAKIMFVMTIAGILTFTRKKSGDGTEKKRYSSTFGVELARRTHINRRVMLITAVVYINMLFLAMQKEMGTMLVLFAVFIAYLFAYDKNKIFLLSNVAICVAVILTAVFFLDSVPTFGIEKVESLVETVDTRVSGWLEPYEMRDDGRGIKGYQVVKSMGNIYRGGFTGTGIENAGTLGGVKAFDSLHCDFIFSAICNEMGLLGGIGVILMYFVLVYRGFKIAISTTNEFNKAVAFGISTMLGVQTFVIIGGVTNLIPLTGITLPFVSHGGSSMMSTFIMLGMLQAISSVKGDTTDEIK